MPMRISKTATNNAHSARLSTLLCAKDEDEKWAMN
jgi:hypothetical protein